MKNRIRPIFVRVGEKIRRPLPRVLICAVRNIQKEGGEFPWNLLHMVLERDMIEPYIHFSDIGRGDLSENGDNLLN
jgi:hypothetical protein